MLCATRCPTADSQGEQECCITRESVLLSNYQRRPRDLSQMERFGKVEPVGLALIWVLSGECELVSIPQPNLLGQASKRPHHLARAAVRVSLYVSRLWRWLFIDSLQRRSTFRRYSIKDYPHIAHAPLTAAPCPARRQFRSDGPK